jgi:hypothetical protein
MPRKVDRNSTLPINGICQSSKITSGMAAWQASRAAWPVSASRLSNLTYAGRLF